MRSLEEIIHDNSEEGYEKIRKYAYALNGVEPKNGKPVKKDEETKEEPC